MLTGSAPPEDTTRARRSDPSGRTRSTETWLLPASTASRSRPPSAICTAPSDARPAPVPAPPARNGEPGSEVSDPSACRSNAAIVFAPVVLSSRYTCPVTGDGKGEADATAGAASMAPAATALSATGTRHRDASRRLAPNGRASAADAPRPARRAFVILIVPPLSRSAEPLPHAQSPAPASCYGQALAGSASGSARAGKTRPSRDAHHVTSGAPAARPPLAAGAHNDQPAHDRRA